MEYDIGTAREVVMDWFEHQGKTNYTSDDIADILDEFEDTVNEIVSEKWN